MAKAAKGSKPNAPKRALSAYMIFSNEQRQTVKEENPDATFGEMGKLLGARWKEMDDNAKKPYVAKAEVEKQRYEREKAAYASGGAVDDDDE
ncbi:hypothetical protein P389DRAFT_198779 [Cystobasidium minutum MCA 4210]|uniref:uncharacterized protein n=1 Tax=Cystobasidium minutum MCA 4210 TaxID=1397322 RepID=UPI0034CEC8FD|eukprot:jgi/Rhomi1/198779/gm1.6993_g